MKVLSNGSETRWKRGKAAFSCQLGAVSCQCQLSAGKGDVGRVQSRIGLAACLRLASSLSLFHPRRATKPPTHRYADTPIRRYADTPTRRHADTPTHFPASPSITRSPAQWRDPHADLPDLPRRPRGAPGYRRCRARHAAPAESTHAS
jgi:hypothetical protein